MKFYVDKLRETNLVPDEFLFSFVLEPSCTVVDVSDTVVDTADELLPWPSLVVVVVVVVSSLETFLSMNETKSPPF